MTQHLGDVQRGNQGCRSGVSCGAVKPLAVKPQSRHSLGSGCIPAVQKLSTQEMENQFECLRLTNTFNSAEKWKSQRTETKSSQMRLTNRHKTLSLGWSGVYNALTETEVSPSLPGPFFLHSKLSVFVLCEKVWESSI